MPIKIKVDSEESFKVKSRLNNWRGWIEISPETCLKSNIAEYNVEITTLFMSTNDTGLVSLFIVLLKLISSAPIKKAENRGSAGIKKEESRRVGIENIVITYNTSLLKTSQIAIKNKTKQFKSIYNI